MLFYGILLALCREAKARRLEASNPKLPVPRCLRKKATVLVAAMPRGWKERTRGEPFSKDVRSARMWLFDFCGDGVEVRRSNGLTLNDAADHIYTHITSA